MPVGAGAPPEDSGLAIKAWNLMRGIEWSAVPLMVELLGVEDVDTFIVQLAALRDWHINNPPEGN